jgi:transposase-like protein
MASQPGRRYHTAAFKAKVVADLKMGVPNAEVATTYKITTGLASQWYRNAVAKGEAPPLTSRNETPDREAVKALVIADRKAGKTVQQIKVIRGISRSTMYDWLRESGNGNLITGRAKVTGRLVHKGAASKVERKDPIIELMELAESTGGLTERETHETVASMRVEIQALRNLLKLVL